MTFYKHFLEFAVGSIEMKGQLQIICLTTNNFNFGQRMGIIHLTRQPNFHKHFMKYLESSAYWFR